MMSASWSNDAIGLGQIRRPGRVVPAKDVEFASYLLSESHPVECLGRIADGLHQRTAGERAQLDQAGVSSVSTRILVVDMGQVCNLTCISSTACVVSAPSLR
jgi:hypothetical protein